VSEYLAGQPLKDEGKRKRWRADNFRFKDHWGLDTLG
jgi:hypothetical protein